MVKYSLKYIDVFSCAILSGEFFDSEGCLLDLQEIFFCLEIVGYLVKGESLRKNRKSHTVAEVKFLTAVKFFLFFG
jgi:hypothetical protein